MMRTVLVAMTLLWAGPAVAGAEKSAAGAQSSFGAGFVQPRFTPGQSQAESVAGRTAALLGTLGSPIDFKGPALAGTVALGTKAPTKEVALGSLKNRQQKTTLKYTLGGKSVWISGAFDREQKAFVSVLEDGKAARFYNVESLLGGPAALDIGTAKFKLSLSPDISDNLESEVVLTDLGTKVKTRVTLREMLAAITATGEALSIGGDGYKLFYYDDVKNGAADASSQSFAFILSEGGEFHVFLVPAEKVPADKIAVFKMKGDKPMGLQNKSGTLRVFDNP
jgi:hypothetical protein